MENDVLSRLREAFEDIPDGPIVDSSRSFLGLLGEAWENLNGSNETKMFGTKIHRVEDPMKRDGKLFFQIERHGGTVNGSSRAALYTWVVDPKSGTATIITETHRQLTASDKRLDVKPLALEVFDIIVQGKDDPKVKWSNDRKECSVNISVVVPQTVRETTLNRRRRFRSELGSLLATKGMSITVRNKVSIEGEV